MTVTRKQQKRKSRTALNQNKQAPNAKNRRPPTVRAAVPQKRKMSELVSCSGNHNQAGLLLPVSNYELKGSQLFAYLLVWVLGRRSFQLLRVRHHLLRLPRPLDLGGNHIRNVRLVRILKSSIGQVCNAQ